MKNKFQQPIFLVLIFVLVLFGIAINDNGNEFKLNKEESLQLNASENIDELLKVYFLDVGQGDSIYIRTPDEQDILIDGGPDKSVLNELGKVMPFWDRDIDVMILTHPHSDHVTGLVEVLRRYNVKQIYYTGVAHTAPDYLAWLNEIKKQNLNLKIVQSFFEINFSDDLKLEFIFPQENLVNQKMANLNNSSIVNRLIYKNVKFIFTGDAEKEVENELVESGVDLSANVLKVGHHGSSTASSEEFLQEVNPQMAVIQCGLDNAFGHPHLQIIRRLERLGIEIFRTDQQGLISIFTDGEKLIVK